MMMPTLMLLLPRMKFDGDDDNGHSDCDGYDGGDDEDDNRD